MKTTYSIDSLEHIGNTERKTTHVLRAIKTRSVTNLLSHTKLPLHKKTTHRKEYCKQFIKETLLEYWCVFTLFVRPTSTKYLFYFILWLKVNTNLSMNRWLLMFIYVHLKIIFNFKTIKLFPFNLKILIKQRHNCTIFDNLHKTNKIHLWVKAAFKYSRENVASLHVIKSLILMTIPVML